MKDKKFTIRNFEVNYYKILSVLNQVEGENSFFNQIRKPKLSDKELISINLTAEYMGVDSESQLFRISPKFLFSKIERSVYNRRKQKLFPFQEHIRQKLALRFNAFEDVFIVDSMPLEVCKLSRSMRSTVCKKDSFSSPDRGYCASQSTYY